MKKFNAKNNNPSKTYICTSSASRGGKPQLSCVESKRLVEASSEKPLVMGPRKYPDLIYLEIYDDFWPDQTGAIFHQFEWQQLLSGAGYAGTNVLEIEKEFVIPVNRTLLDTQPNPGAPIYGYNGDGTLDLTGGRAKSYDPGFTKVRTKYNGAKEGKFYDPSGTVTQLLEDLTPEAIKDYMDTFVSYYTSRGFPIQGPDTFKKFEDQYIWQFPAGQNQAFTSGGYVAIRPIWHANRNVPDYIDLHATANNNPNEYFVLDTFLSDLSLAENGHGYPLRIPVTTDLCEYQNSGDPIAFYDQDAYVLSIRVPDPGNGYFLTNRIVNTGNPALDVDYEEHLLAFEGSFAIIKKTKSKPTKCKIDRRRTNNDDSTVKLVNGQIEDAYVFAQVSETVHIKSRVIDFGIPASPDYELFNPIRSDVYGPSDPTIYYTGVVCAKMNGGSPSFDFYVVPIPAPINDFSIAEDPLQYPENGDNPQTTLVEQYGNLSQITLHFYKQGGYNLVAKVPKKFIDTVGFYPEIANISPVPSHIGNAEAWKWVASHEFEHQCQFASGIINLMPSEAMAVGMETDAKLMGDIIFPSRMQNMSNRHLRFTRGAFTAMRSDTQGVSTYGASMFWIYLRGLFDFNNQVMRRIADILTNETAGPLFKANDFPDITVLTCINNSGGSAALNQSLAELFGKDVKTIWNNFSIALTMLRNNTAIPAEYRVHYPYWMYNTQYSGYPLIYASMSTAIPLLPAPFPLTPFAPWWEMLDTNAVIPANWFSPFTGQTVLRTLPASFSTSIKDLHSVSFNVPHALTTITITITAGEWMLTLFQFTSDGTQVGSWIQDGPFTIIGSGVHVFTVTGHVPAFTATGNIRLTCANVSFSGTGNVLADYFSPEPNTGSIHITSV